MSSDNILVAIKSRPLISREKSEKLRSQWTVQEKAIFQIDEDGHRLGEPYSFDHVFTELATNSSVYSAVVEPLVKSFLNGFNSTIFAYGQTSSGKTHTMMGAHNTLGIIQLAISDVFQHVSRNPQRRYLISCSYFEIYNEKINDLLDKNGQDLKIREDFCGNTFVNAKEELVNQQAEVFELMKIGSKIRKIGCTNMNERSSRSHTIFRFTIKSTENNIEHGPVQISHLNLVDLAGSERIAHTKAEGVRLKEGVNINKSLLALGNVIRQLSEGEGYINYRDSNLTRLLQHALGGNAKSLIIATITVAAGEETKSTLEFAQRAKVVKNKPIINEILSEQVKLKQYELATAGYKERLEKERKRIKEMEQEKEEREREITKLKQQVKLIDLFTNGPEVKKSESKIPRRHTMGHYTRIPLQTIPESKVLCSNIMQDKDIENTMKGEDEDELLFKSISQVSNYDYIKMTIEESLDEGILAITPEPQEETEIKEETTPSSHLRERLKHLEESYMALQEFTKLEAECKEDKDVLYELSKEKENLLKDVIDLNAIIKELRQEKEKMKVTFEDEYSALKKDLDVHKKKSNKLEFALEQAETEKDVLRLAKEQLLNDDEFRLEQQRLQYEKQLQYYVGEIERLNKENDDSNKIDYNFEEELQKLRKENENFKMNVERITTYEDKIVQLEEKLEEFEKKKEEDGDVLSVSTQTDEIEVTAKTKEEFAKELREITNETIIIQKECDELKDTMCKMTDELERIHLINVELEEELRRHKLRGSASFIELQNLIHLEKELADKKEEVLNLMAKIGNLENENKIHLTKIDSQNEEIHLSNEKISQLTNELEDFQKRVHSHDEKSKELLDEIDKLKDTNQNQNNQLNLQMDEIKSKNENIVHLNDKVEQCEKSITNLEKDILDYKEQIQSRDVTISDLTNEMKQLEATHKSCFDEINAFNVELDSKSAKITSLEEKIHEVEADKQKYIHELEQYALKVHEQENCIRDLKIEASLEIQEIQDEVQKLNENYEQQTELFKKEVICKEEEISILLSKCDAIKAEQTQNLEKLASYENEISTLENKLGKLEKDNDNYKQEINILKEELSTKEKNMAALTEKVSLLENDNQRYLKEVPNKKEIQQIQHLQEENKIQKQSNKILKEQMAERDQTIAELNSAVTNLKNINYNWTTDIQCKDDSISKLTSEVSTQEETISKLKDKIQKLETDNSNLEMQAEIWKKEIENKQFLCSELNNAVKNLEKSNNDNKNEIKTRNHQILELVNKIEDLENHKEKMEKDIHIKSINILELNNKIKDLETCIHNNAEEIKTSEKTNLEFSKKISSLMKNIQDNEHEIQLKNEQILQLADKITGLEVSIHNKKEKIKTKDNQIAEMTNKVSCLQMDKEKNEKDVCGKNTHISELNARIHLMQTSRHPKDEQIEELSNKIKDLNDEIVELKNDNESKTKTISELQLMIHKLDEDCRSYENEVSHYKEERKIKELTKHGGGADVTNKKTEDYKDIDDLNKIIADLTSENNKLEKKLDQIKTQNEQEKVALRTKIYDLEDVITELKVARMTKKLESLPPKHSHTSSSETSPKEIRRRKRQSIHDQRRGIDLSGNGNEDREPAEAAAEVLNMSEAGLKTKIRRMDSVIEHLFQENENLETEVQGFIGELNDQKKYNAEKDFEIDMLTEQIKKLKKGMGQEDCKECPQKQHYIKKLEDLQKQNNFKIVELQTRYYDLQNKMKDNMTNSDDKEKVLRYRITELEKKLGENVQSEFKNVEVQCDIMNFEQLLEKYVKVKKLARMRRDETNALKAQLGINSDEQPT